MKFLEQTEDQRPGEVFHHLVQFLDPAIFSNVRMARIESKYLIYKQTSQYPGQGLGFTFAFSIKPKIFVVSLIFSYKVAIIVNFSYHTNIENTFK